MAGFQIEYQQMMDSIDEQIQSITPTKAQLEEIADRAIMLIQDRTRKGIDYEGNAFESYSSGYAAHRKRTGRKTKPVTLEYDGLMLSSITRHVSGDSVILSFSSSDAGRIANYHNSLEPRSKIPLRRFLDLVEGTDAYRKTAALAVDLLAEQLS